MKSSSAIKMELKDKDNTNSDDTLAHWHGTAGDICTMVCNVSTNAIDPSPPAPRTAHLHHST